MEEIINPGPETAAQPPLTRADLEAELAALTEAFQTRLDAQQQETKQQRQALEAQEAALRQRELIAKARQELQQRQLPISLAEALPFANETALESGLNALEEAFCAAVQQGVEERLLSAAPKAAPVKAPSEMTDEEYYAAVCC